MRYREDTLLVFYCQYPLCIYFHTLVLLLSLYCIYVVLLYSYILGVYTLYIYSYTKGLMFLGYPCGFLVLYYLQVNLLWYTLAWRVPYVVYP